MCISLMAGCGDKATPAQSAQLYVDEANVAVEELTDEALALSEAPVAAVPNNLKLQDQTAGTGTQIDVPAANTAGDANDVKASFVVPEASGRLVKKTAKATIDYSNTADGYVMVRFTGISSKRLRARVEGPATTYTYDIKQGEWTVFPLSDGNGKYQFKVYENVSGNRYSVVASASCNVELKDEFAPFIRPNQYVDYSLAEKTVSKAWELTKDLTDPLKKVEVVYSYVVKNLSYDREKASTVTSGYLPVLDTILEGQKGICFDYAALMTGMLRSQGVPCKLVIGYAGTAYHAWISVWTEATGWIDGAVYFDGASWYRMDPTFASSGGQSKEIMAYIGNGANYTVKYLY